MEAAGTETGIYTETLARLYLKQGFTAQALAIYRRVAEEQPGNQALQARLHTLEHDIALGLLGQETVGPRVAPPVPAHGPPEPTRTAQQQVITQLGHWLHALQTRCRQPERTATEA